MSKTEQFRSEVTAHRATADAMRENAVLAYITGKHGAPYVPEFSGIVSGGLAGLGLSNFNKASEHSQEAAALSGTLAQHELKLPQDSEEAQSPEPA